MSDTDVSLPLPAALQRLKPVVMESGLSAGLPLHFGWPAHEQETFERGQAFVFLGVMGVVTVSGPDRLSWLTTLSSQVLTDLKPGDSKEALLLDPQGRVSFQLAVVDDGERTWLITEWKYAEALTRFLTSMQFMLRVQIADVSAGYRGVSTCGESDAGAAATAEWVTGHGGIVWTDPWPGVEDGGARYFLETHPGGGATFRVSIVPADQIEDFIVWLMDLREEPMTPAGALAADAIRIAAWRPVRVSEVDDRTLPAELDLLRTAVHLNKGCYCGQESVARIVNLGRPPRRLVFLQLDGSAETLPEPGSVVELNGRQVGVLTSVARHWEMGPIALALVKRTLDPDVPLKVGGVDAVQELIVPVEGRSDHSPQERPGVGLRKIDSGKRDIRTRGPGAGG